MKKGFTLIELLVVIAIIGVLSSIVLASLNSARNNGRDAAVSSQLANIRTQAEIIADSNSGSYATVCSNAGVVNMLNAAGTAAGATGAATCYDTSAAWAASADLSTSGEFWCVDSTGASEQTAAMLVADPEAVVCP